MCDPPVTVSYLKPPWITSGNFQLSSAFKTGVCTKHVKLWVASLKQPWGRRQLYEFRAQRRRNCSVTLLPVLPTSQMYSSWSAHVTLGQAGIDAAFSVCIRTHQGNKFRRHSFLGGLQSLGKNWGHYSGLQKRRGGEILGFTMQQRGIYEHISGKVWKEWWANIFGNHALLLLLPIKQHASQLRKPKSKSSSVAPGRELCMTVKLLRKGERKY